MHNDIISQNVKLMDEKLIINERKFEPKICDRCICVVYKVKDYRERVVKTFINYDYPVLLKYNQRRLICDCGKTMPKNNSIVSKGSKI